MGHAQAEPGLALELVEEGAEEHLAMVRVREGAAPVPHPEVVVPGQPPPPGHDDLVERDRVADQLGRLGQEQVAVVQEHRVVGARIQTQPQAADALARRGGRTGGAGYPRAA